jgi:hypothetical protein
MTTETFFERVQAMIESRYDYETSHQDAGDNYAHLSAEGEFDYHNGGSRLQEYCDEMGIDLTGVDLDRLAEDVIFWGYMNQGQAYDAQKRFLISSYNVGEVEIQVDASEIGASFTPYLIDQLNRNTEAFWRYDTSETAYFYINASDSYWDHVCDADVIIDLVEQQKDN